MSIEWDMTKDGPALRAEVITLTDNSTDLTDVARAIYVGKKGDLKVTMVGGVDVTFSGLLGGQVYPLGITKVWSGGTTATSLIALR
jgi:hypothetical protein